MSESDVVKVHKMKVVVTGKRYFHDESGCGGHIPAKLVCSCGQEISFDDPDPHMNQEMIDRHKREVIKAAGFVFELVK